MIARRISLFTGLYLFAFLFVHLVNLSLGLHSVAFMDEARSWLTAPWSNPVGGGLLALCLLFHMALGLRALYLRNTLRMSQFDAFQLLLGLCIPLLLFPHIITMSMVDQDLGYQQVLSLFWNQSPLLGLRQVVGLMVVWLHSCMGLFIWMRLQVWWGKVSLFVYPTVVLLPTLAMLGFVEAGKEVIAGVEPMPSAYQSSTSSANYESGYGDTYAPVTDTTDPNSVGDAAAEYSNRSDYSGKSEGSSSNNSSSAETLAGADEIAANASLQSIGRVVQMVVYGYLLLVVLVLAARAWRLYPQRQETRIRIGDSKEIITTSGASLLEISRLNDVAHASLCGGKGRCGTCQVAIVSGQENLTATTEVEAHKLKQINAAANIRLACQARVNGGVIEVEPVLPAFVVANDMPLRRASAAGADAGSGRADSLSSTGEQS